MSVVDSTNPHQFSYDPETGVCYRTLDFLGFPGYRVGDDGSVWSRRTIVPIGGGKRGMKSAVGTNWRPMRPGVASKGYLFIVMKAINKFVNRLIHHLVLLAFVGPRTDGMECRHFSDRDPSNNRVENLRWGTAEQNNNDKKHHGTHQQGIKIHQAKLNDSTVKTIRQKWDGGKTTIQKLADEYHVSWGTISFVVKRKTWKHVV